MNLWERHIIDSAQLINFFPKGYDKFIDIGSGAGFPGLVLKILDNKLMGHLVESNTKKAKFLSNTSKLLGVDIKIHNERFENLKKFKKIGKTSVLPGPITIKNYGKNSEMHVIFSSIVRKFFTKKI